MSPEEAADIRNSIYGMIADGMDAADILDNVYMMTDEDITAFL